MARNLGAIALGRTGKSQTAIAAELGVSVVTVHHWCTGEKKPGPANRAKLRELYGIEEPMWDETPKRKPPAAAKVEVEALAPPAPSDATVVGGAFGMARELELMARQQMTELREDMGKPQKEREGTPLETARVMTSLVATIAQLAKLTGQYDLGRKMLQLPLWKRLESELALALRPWPQAAKAVAEAFERLEATEG